MRRRMSNTPPPNSTTWAWPAGRALRANRSRPSSRPAFPGPRPARTWAPSSPSNEDATLAQARRRRALAAGTPRRWPACRWRTRTSSSPAASPPPPPEDAGRLPVAVRRHRGRAPGRPAGHPGQAQLRRVRHGLGQRELGRGPVGFDARPVRNPWDTSRVPGGSSGGSPPRGRAPGAGRHRHRHRRLHPPAGQRSAASPASSPPTAAPAATA
jgi:hypothetical protein